MSSRADRVVADPIYGYVTVPFRLLPLLDEPHVQRLRRISQTAMAEHVYPSLTGRRFAHSLGSMHLARLAFRAALERTPSDHLRRFFRIVNRDAGGVTEEALADLLGDAVAAVALLHDVGHTPFSHTLERPYADLIDCGLPVTRAGDSFHEAAGRVLASRMLRRLEVADLPENRPYSIDEYSRWPLFAELTVAIVQSDIDGENGTWQEALHSLVASQVDVDRIDYLMRDARLAGTEYGRINYSRLLESLEIRVDGEERVRLGPGARARPAAERLLSEREQAYRWIYYHPRAIVQDHCLAQAVVLAIGLETSGELLPGDQRMVTESDTVGEFLKRIRPNLCYVGRGDVAAAGGVSEEDRLASLVDDSTVTEWLKAIYGALHPIVESAVDPRIPMLDAYLRAFLFRAKVLAPAWKSYGEYQSLANSIRDKIVGVIARRGGEALAAGRSFEADWLSNLGDAWRRDPASAMTHLLSETSSLPGLDLGAYLSEDRRFHWEVARREFSAATQAAFVFVDEEMRPLVETSPIVKALASASLMLPQVYVLVRPVHGTRAEVPAALSTMLQSYFELALPILFRFRAIGLEGE